MMISIVIFFAFYLAFVGAIVLLGFFLNSKKVRAMASEKKISASEITVLIPFRDEEERIHVLLKSIRNLNKFPKEIIFINDHSTDEGMNLIEKSLGNIPHIIMKAPAESHGKKLALRFATKKCSTKYILTWDADIYFKPDYFEQIEELSEADMYILPAVLTAESAMEYLYEIDVVLANAVNTGIAGLKRPIMASGANLLYKREVFNEVDDLDSHGHMASGDDTYLLRDFRNDNKDVRVVSGLECAVYTETPRSFLEFIDQRLRWLGKMTDIKDRLGTFVALFQLILSLTFFGLMAVTLVYCDWNLFGIVLFGKIAADLILFLPFFTRMRRLRTWALIPVYELLFPIYSLLLLILMFTYKPKWKGRVIA